MRCTERCLPPRNYTLLLSEKLTPQAYVAVGTPDRSHISSKSEHSLHIGRPRRRSAITPSMISLILCSNYVIQLPSPSYRLLVQLRPSGTSWSTEAPLAPVYVCYLHSQAVFPKQERAPISQDLYRPRLSYAAQAKVPAILSQMRRYAPCACLAPSRSLCRYLSGT